MKSIEIILLMNNKMNQKEVEKKRKRRYLKRERNLKMRLNRKIISIMKYFMIRKIKN
jgi:hypothetical protein